MPTYAYACTTCEHSFEVQQSFTEDSLTQCPECAGRIRKLFSSVGIVFKGSGFYRTDSRKASSDATPAGTAADKKGSDKSDGGTTDRSSSGGEKSGSSSEKARSGNEKSGSSAAKSGNSKPAKVATSGSSAA